MLLLFQLSLLEGTEHLHSQAFVLEVNMSFTLISGFSTKDGHKPNYAMNWVWFIAHEPWFICLCGLHTAHELPWFCGGLFSSWARHAGAEGNSWKPFNHRHNTPVR